METVIARSSDVDAHREFVQWISDAGQAAPERLDLTDGVTLSEAEVLGLFYNANLRVTRLNASVALARFETAGLWQDPVFGFDGAQILHPGNEVEYGASLSLTLPVSGRLAVEEARAGAAYEVELRRIVHEEWRLRARVRQAWYAWSAAERRRHLLEGVIQQVERIADLAEQLEMAGVIREADARLLRIELVGRRAELTAATLASQQGRVRLLGLMGLAVDSQLDLLVGPSTLVPPICENPAKRIAASNTELAVLKASYLESEEALRLAIRRQYPDVGFGAGFGSEDRDTRMLFGFTLPIPLLNRNRAEIAVARTRREATRGAVEAALERLVREVEQAELSLAAAHEQREQLVNELEPLLREQSSNIDRLAEIGDVDAFLLLETVGRQFDAQSRLIELERAENTAMADLVLLLGPSANPSPTATDDVTLPPSGLQSAGSSTPETSR